MNKEEKKEISLATTVKAVITGYVAYGILIGFIVYIVGVLVNWCLSSLPNVNMKVVSISVPLLASFILYFVVRGICKLSIHDVFKKCKTNPENLPKAITRLNLFIIIAIVVYIVATVLLMMLNFSNEQKAIMVSSYQYKTIHSEEFATSLTNEMLEQFEEEKINTVISTIIIELGMTVSLFSVIPLQKKLINKENEF